MNRNLVTLSPMWKGEWGRDIWSFALFPLNMLPCLVYWIGAVSCMLTTSCIKSIYLFWPLKTTISISCVSTPETKLIYWWYSQYSFHSSLIGTFLRSKLKFSKLPVQSSHHCVICAHQKSSFSFLWIRCICFGTSLHIITYNSLLFSSLSIAYVM